MLSKVEFAALLTYSPRGTSEVSTQSRRVSYAIKRGEQQTLTAVVTYLEDCFQQAGLDSFVGPDVVLVPTPRSSPLVEGALWPARRICEEMSKQGLGQEVLTCLKRTEAVPKSAFSRPGERPDADRHLSTMAVDPSLIGPERITVVDDVITKGNTLYAAVCRVQEAFPDSEVRAFALVRTMGLIPEIEKIRDPCVGNISYWYGDVKREP